MDLNMAFELDPMGLYMELDVPWNHTQQVLRAFLQGLGHRFSGG